MNAIAAVPLLLQQLRTAHPAITPHIILDSAFGGLDTLNVIRQMGAHATMSISPTQMAPLWEVLHKERFWEDPIDHLTWI